MRASVFSLRLMEDTIWLLATLIIIVEVEQQMFTINAKHDMNAGKQRRRIQFVDKSLKTIYLVLQKMSTVIYDQPNSLHFPAILVCVGYYILAFTIIASISIKI